MSKQLDLFVQQMPDFDMMPNGKDELRLRLRLCDMGMFPRKNGSAVRVINMEVVQGAGPARPGPSYGGRMTLDGPRVDGSSQARDAMNRYLADAWPRFEANCADPEFARWFEDARDSDGKVKL